MVLLDRITHPDIHPAVVARKVLATMEPSAYVDRHTLQIKPSIGVGVQRGPLRDAGRLLTQIADEAMYATKRSAEVRFFALEC